MSGLCAQRVVKLLRPLPWGETRSPGLKCDDVIVKRGQHAGVQQLGLIRTTQPNADDVMFYIPQQLAGLDHFGESVTRPPVVVLPPTALQAASC